MFCTQLRALRVSLGLTQRAMAGALGLSASALGMYEQGRRVPGPKTAARMARFFALRGLILPPAPPAPEGPPPQLLGRGKAEVRGQRTEKGNLQ